MSRLLLELEHFVRPRTTFLLLRHRHAPLQLRQARRLLLRLHRLGTRAFGLRRARTARTARTARPARTARTAGLGAPLPRRWYMNGKVEIPVGNTTVWAQAAQHVRGRRRLGSATARPLRRPRLALGCTAQSGGAPVPPSAQREAAARRSAHGPT